MSIEVARIAHCNARIFVLEQQLINSEYLSPEEFFDIGNKLNILESRIECADGQIKAKVKMEKRRGENIASQINIEKFNEL